jgi:hypothetical protein
MADQDTPEAGERCKVRTGKGEEIAIWTGFMWATEDGSRILEGSEIESWEEAPHEGELTIRKQDEGD